MNETILPSKGSSPDFATNIKRIEPNQLTFMSAEITRKRFSDYSIFEETKNVPEFENIATQIKTYCSLMKYYSIYSFIQP